MAAHAKVKMFFDIIHVKSQLTVMNDYSWDETTNDKSD